MARAGMSGLRCLRYHHALPFRNTGSRPQHLPTIGASNLNYIPRRQRSSHTLHILQPEFWRAIVPKAFRKSSERADGQPQSVKKKSKEWNPATFFIIIFMFIGSQAIQMITLQRNFDLFTFQTDAKLNLLREVVRRVRAGEDVDVEAMLGTGDGTKEKEWEEVIKELEEEETRLASVRKAKRAQSIEEAKRREQMAKAESPRSTVDT